MEALFSSHGVSHTRVVAVDGRIASDVDRCLELSPPPWAVKEYATSASHLYAINCFLQDRNNTCEYGMICEDDLSFEYIPHWSKPLADYVSASPNDWEVLQMSVLSQDHCMGDLNIQHAVPRLQPVWYSTCAYLIKRESAMRLMNRVMMPTNKSTEERPRIWLPLPPPQYPHAMFADHLIFRECKTYSIPLFTYTGLDSSINPDCVPGHIYHKRAITHLWSTFGTPAKTGTEKTE